MPGRHVMRTGCCKAQPRETRKQWEPWTGRDPWRGRYPWCRESLILGGTVYSSPTTPGATDAPGVTEIPSLPALGTTDTQRATAQPPPPALGAFSMAPGATYENCSIELLESCNCCTLRLATDLKQRNQKNMQSSTS